MSYPQIQTTNYYLNAIADDGDDILTSESKLNMMAFPVAGSAQTYDSTSFCPDSASTATSIATGHKTYSGTINMDETMETPYETIAEKLKKQLGYKVGILSSVNLNHATPAAFYAHQATRGNYYKIGEELIASDFDYFAGGDLKKTTGAEGDKTDFDTVMADITELFGLQAPVGDTETTNQADSKDEHPEGEDKGSLVMTDYEYGKLKAAYDETMSRTGEEEEFGREEYILYGSYEPLTVTITHILNNKSGINFASYAHTGLPVEVMAMGAGQQQFKGYYDNTDIYNKLAALTGVN